MRSGKEGFFRPLIDFDSLPDEPKLLSFTNLIEAYVLSAMRRVHRIPMHKVRDTIEFVLKKLDRERPLAHVDFETDGVDLFISELDTLVAASDRGQVSMREIIRMFLQRIERNEEKAAVRLFPFTRSSGAMEDPRVIVIDPKVSFGQPVIVGTGIPVEAVVSRYRAGESHVSLSDDYSGSIEVIEEAIRCALPKAA